MGVLNVLEWQERWPMPDDEALCEVLKSVHDFGEKKLEPAYQDIEVEGNFPDEIIKTIGNFGWLGFIIPETYGGWGRGAVEAAYMMRSLAYWSPSVSLITTAHWLSATTIVIGGTEAQKERVLPKQASGTLGCFALTEPEAGSDARAQKTRAERTKVNTWNVNGEKVFITNPQHAQYMTLLARTGDERGDISAFSIESDEVGFTNYHPNLTVTYRPKPYFRGSEFSDLRFENLELPHDALLGKEGKGFDVVVLKTLEAGRINIAAQAIGLAMWIYDETYAYAEMRKMFGKTLLKMPGIPESGVPSVEEHFADVKERLDRVWRKVIKTADYRYCDADSLARSAAVKIRATETAFAVASEIIDYWGGILTDPGCTMIPCMNNIKVTCNYEGANKALRKAAGTYLHADI